MSPNPSHRPNIVLITADSFRADHCGFIDSNGTTLTPTLDDMADRGLSFTQAVSPGPRTPSSVPEILTGKYLPNDSINITDWQSRLGRVRDHIANHTTLAEQLSELGYTTLAYSGNPWVSRQTGFDDVFNTFYEVGNEGTRNLNVFSGTRFESLSLYLDWWWNNKGFFARWDRFLPTMLDHLENSDRPYFLWLLLMDTHNPYHAPRSVREESSLIDLYAGQLRANNLFNDQKADSASAYWSDIPEWTVKSVKKSYRDAVRSVDRCAARIQDATEDDDPVIVFHSDHGEAFNDHGTFGHQRELYEENIRVPLVVFNGDQIGTNRKMISLRSLSNMIYKYVTENIGFDHEQWQPDHTILRTEDNSKFGVRTENWKYIQSKTNEWLFNHQSDPKETENRLDRQSRKTSELREVVNHLISELSKESGDDHQEIEPSEEIENRLKDLGYI